MHWGAHVDTHTTLCYQVQPPQVGATELAGSNEQPKYTTITNLPMITRKGLAHRAGSDFSTLRGGSSNFSCRATECFFLVYIGHSYLVADDSWGLVSLDNALMS